MEKICDKSQCTGCGLCSNRCPQNAIDMRENALTGHYEPRINIEKCIDCGLCLKLCPALGKSQFHRVKVCYAAWQTDGVKRTGSSSGGVAAALYEMAIKNGYYVVGAYLDDTLSVKMALTDSLEYAKGFKGSKYVQADCGKVYCDSMERLQKGDSVLFVGTPCQCAAMRSIAGTKWEPNLLTVELICHGTPSQKIFREYMELMEKKKHKKITAVSFRSSSGEEMQLWAGKKQIWKQLWTEDVFLYAFQKGLLHNESCYGCIYARSERASDITIGDFWKIGREMAFKRPDCKVSVVTVNTDKGADFLRKCKGLHLEERIYEEAVNGNPNLRHPSKKHPQYDVFWDVYEKRGLKGAFSATIEREVSYKRFKNNVVRAMKKPVKKVLGKLGIYKGR